jgi:hypothetical protein
LKIIDICVKARLAAVIAIQQCVITFHSAEEISWCYFVVQRERDGMSNNTKQNAVNVMIWKSRDKLGFEDKNAKSLNYGIQNLWEIQQRVKLTVLCAAVGTALVSCMYCVCRLYCVQL